MMTRKNKTTATGKRREERLEVYKHTHAVRTKEETSTERGTDRKWKGTARHSTASGIITVQIRREERLEVYKHTHAVRTKEETSTERGTDRKWKGTARHSTASGFITVRIRI